jgi:hypothetical protein
MIIYIAYKKNKSNIEVNLASHTQNVPHIGLPHKEPETRVRPQKSTPGILVEDDIMKNNGFL